MSLSKPAKLYLGLPAWAFPGWSNRYFVDEPSRLASYASVFNTVEGNTTFYRTPDGDTVARWRDAVAGTDFRFCLKLPKVVTHEPKPDMRALRAFLDVVNPLAKNLGPLLVQFPANVGPADLQRIEHTLSVVSEHHECALEVRHPKFFEHPELLLPVLERTDSCRITLDAQPIHQGNREHPEVLAALHKKPDLPVLTGTVGGRAFVRLVLHPDLESNGPWMSEWVAQTAGYLGAGIETWMMIHCPNNQHCPPLAREFHRQLSAFVDLPPLAAWPLPEQMSLV